MLLFENGRFHVAGVSFALFDGFYLESSPDMEIREGVTLYTPDKICSVEIRLADEEESTEEFLRDVLREMKADVIQPLSPVKLNGLVGHHTTYRDGVYSYYEARFDLPAKYEEYTQFSILAVVKKNGSDIVEVKKSEAFQKLINSIRVD